LVAVIADYHRGDYYTDFATRGMAGFMEWEKKRPMSFYRNDVDTLIAFLKTKGVTKFGVTVCNAPLFHPALVLVYDSHLHPLSADSIG
jgi:hypothetical protein